MADTELESAAAATATPGIGHNNPAETVAAEYDLLLKADPLLDTFQREGDGKYLETAAEVQNLLLKIGGQVEGVAGVPKVIETDAENGLIAAYMTDLRTSTKSIEAYHKTEKAPYLAAGRAIDNYFGAFLAKIAKTQEILQARGNDYTRRKVAQARAEAEAAAKAERERLAEIAAAAQRERDAALEAAAAAARARKPENIERLETAAVTATQNAQVLAIDQMVQEQKAEEARNATLASTASLARTRFESGHMATGKQVGYVEITDIEQIDLNVLRQFIKPDAILSALKGYGKFHNHKVPAIDAPRLRGAIIEMRDAADYR